MRLAVISDIHSNAVALDAVVADLATLAPDVVVVAGDFINRGPQPREVCEQLFALGWPLLRGNHEDYVLAQRAGYVAADAAEAQIMRPSRWTAEQTEPFLAAIAALPDTISLTAPDGSAVLIAHASPRHNREGVYRFTTDDELRAMLGPTPPALYCCGHTHQSLIRRVDNTLIVNVGSVGLPFNGDWHAQYGVLDWTADSWRVELRAIPYDRERSLRTYVSSGFLESGGPLARVIRQELVSALPELGPWYGLFADEVRAGRIGMAESIEQYLALPRDQISRY